MGRGEGFAMDNNVFATGKHMGRCSLKKGNAQTAREERRSLLFSTPCFEGLSKCFVFATGQAQPLKIVHKQLS